MRHLRKRHKLNRPQDQRRALLRSLATALFLHGEITTTLAKAKALKPYAERIISKAKQGDLHSRRMASKKIYDQLTGNIMCADCKKVISVDQLTEEGKCAECGGKIISETVLRKLFSSIAKEYEGRNGGYTRIYHLPPRRGDAAPMALIQLV
jgi:large subunit ribosomal protein L17